MHFHCLLVPVKRLRTRVFTSMSESVRLLGASALLVSAYLVFCFLPTVEYEAGARKDERNKITYNVAVARDSCKGFPGQLNPRHLDFWQGLQREE